jgi:BASS family bile acid:Na+ symporter
MLHRLRSIVESYLFVLIAALLVGVFVPQSRALVAWNILFLQIIFFLSSMKLDWKRFATQIRDWKTVLVSGAVMLIGFPLLVRLGLFWLPDSAAPIAFAFFLLAAMPSGMTSPLLVELVDGNQPLALVITITTSLLAPFTVPLLVQLAYGTSIYVNALDMFRTLALVIFLPFAVAVIVKYLAPKVAAKVAPKTKPLSTILLGLLIAGAVAPHGARIIAAVQTDILGFLLLIVALFAFFAALHVLGFYAAWWKKRHDRQTVSICLTYMNFTLAIFLAGTYFPNTDIVLTLVLSILPWATLLPVWKRVSARLK